MILVESQISAYRVDYVIGLLIALNYNNLTSSAELTPNKNKTFIEITPSLTEESYCLYIIPIDGGMFKDSDNEISNSMMLY